MSQATSQPSLRLATISDVPALTKLIENLFNHSVYSTVTSFNPEYVQNAIRGALAGKLEESGILILEDLGRPVGCLSMARVGFMGGKELAIETTFWVEPEYRTQKNLKLLLQAYLFWAKKVGCKGALIGKLKNKHSPEFYKVVRI